MDLLKVIEDSHGGTFSLEWRRERVRLGDENMRRASEIIDGYSQEMKRTGENMTAHDLDAINSRASVLILAAQAHYMAANVRGRA